MIESTLFKPTAPATQDGRVGEIVLATLNAKYIHSAFGLRYLQANLAELQDRSVIEEFTLDSRPEDVVEVILRHHPKIVGLGVYIWNGEQTLKVVALLKAVAPSVVIVLGGPEVSYEQEGQEIVALSDYVISGWGEVSFRDLSRQLLAGQVVDQCKIAGLQPKLDQLRMPYDLYTAQDIKNRVLYVEASRGCPFKCEFCLSALDKTAWPFDLDEFLAHMDQLYKRGARHFKFVDRTFNLKIKNSLRILEFFLARMDDELFLHFEVVPDHLPDALKSMITKFPSGSLQFEIGIQTFNPEVQSSISRRQNNEQAKINLEWIRDNTQAYIHADLIFGLPGEPLESFAQSFDQLYALRPHEIQVGILKRLKGSPIIRHTDAHQLVFNPSPPFGVVSSDMVSYEVVQKVGRFARYWDLIGNSGRFKSSLKLILADQPFMRFALFTDALFALSGRTHKISLLRLYDYVHDICINTLEVGPEQMTLAIEIDHGASGLKSKPKCLLLNNLDRDASKQLQTNRQRNLRQSRH